ncbi:hypothetical protein SDC9_122935 [bioreactor metagenome]|uniref:Uncharacterized protein n=1 Tax=bioreactor metagenome TaxID=1076179 RepID=A0A645CG73_9ZZZZ
MVKLCKLGGNDRVILTGEQEPVDSLMHLTRCLAGEGQGEYLRSGRLSLQNQPQKPVAEDCGLPRARTCTDDTVHISIDCRFLIGVKTGSLLGKHSFKSCHAVANLLRQSDR